MSTLTRLLHRVYSRVVRAGDTRIGKIVRTRWYALWARPGARSLGECFPCSRRVRVERVPGSRCVRLVQREPETNPELPAELRALAAALAELRTDSAKKASSQLTELARRLTDTAGATRVSLIAVGKSAGTEDFLARSLDLPSTGLPAEQADAAAEALVCRMSG